MVEDHEDPVLVGLNNYDIRPPVAVDVVGGHLTETVPERDVDRSADGSVALAVEDGEAASTGNGDVVSVVAVEVVGQELGGARLVVDPGLDEGDGRRCQGNNRPEGGEEERHGVE